MSWHSDDRPTEHAPSWADDDALAADLAAAVAGGPLHDRVVAAGTRAFAAHRAMLDARAGLELDLLLLELVYDSREAGELAGVRDRSGGSSRTLVFEGEGLGVEIEVGDGSIEGQLIPPRRGSVTLRTPDEVVSTVETDEVGYFRFDVRPGGTLRLECTSADGTCVTQWLPF
ncbi:hypothetical protein [Cellulomonas massiliensis]|uniref:hypothetical protein n=1 Tax=Cellulomonas massiliensis TaxID=1465811 RepID=UPI0003047520|nr:hypothetical protein [Cellulomonas massiliensis]